MGVFVFDKKTNVMAACGKAESLDKAKAIAEEAAGGKPQWRNIGKEIEKAREGTRALRVE